MAGYDISVGKDLLPGCGASFSKSTVSALCVGLDARGSGFQRTASGRGIPVRPVDTLFVKSREEDRVVIRPALHMSPCRRRCRHRSPFVGVGLPILQPIIIDQCREHIFQREGDQQQMRSGC